MLDADPSALLLAPLALSLDNELGATYLKMYAALAPVAKERVLGLDDWPEMRPVVGGLAKPLDRACRAADERVRAICDEHATRVDRMLQAHEARLASLPGGDLRERGRGAAALPGADKPPTDDESEEEDEEEDAARPWGTSPAAEASGSREPWALEDAPRPAAADDDDGGARVPKRRRVPEPRAPSTADSDSRRYEDGEDDDSEPPLRFDEWYPTISQESRKGPSNKLARRGVAPASPASPQFAPRRPPASQPREEYEFDDDGVQDSGLVSLPRPARAGWSRKTAFYDT